MDPLYVIVIVLLVLWVGSVGVGGFYAGGGVVHLLLVIALVIVVVRLLRGERI